MKYERPAKTNTKEGRQTERTNIGRFVIDEMVKPTTKTRPEPQVRRIEDMNVEEIPKQRREYRTEPHIGTLRVKSDPTEEHPDKVAFYNVLN